MCIICEICGICFTSCPTPYIYIYIYIKLVFLYIWFFSVIFQSQYRLSIVGRDLNVCLKANRAKATCFWISIIWEHKITYDEHVIKFHVSMDNCLSFFGINIRIFRPNKLLVHSFVYALLRIHFMYSDLN